MTEVRWKEPVWPPLKLLRVLLSLLGGPLGGGGWHFLPQEDLVIRTGRQPPRKSRVDPPGGSQEIWPVGPAE